MKRWIENKERVMLKVVTQQWNDIKYKKAINSIINEFVWIGIE